jgi:hypothetical protein
MEYLPLHKFLVLRYNKSIMCHHYKSTVLIGYKSIEHSSN